jgi:hypothetical protein
VFVILGLFCPFQEKSFIKAKIISLLSQILEKKSGNHRKLTKCVVKWMTRESLKKSESSLSPAKIAK